MIDTEITVLSKSEFEIWCKSEEHFEVIYTLWREKKMPQEQTFCKEYGNKETWEIQNCFILSPLNLIELDKKLKCLMKQKN